MEGAANMITSALSNVTTVFNAAVDMATGNPVSMVFVGFALIGAGLGIFFRLTSRR